MKQCCRFQLFHHNKGLFPLSFLQKCLPCSPALWPDFYLPLFPMHGHWLCLPPPMPSLRTHWYSPKLFSSSTSFRWGPLRQMQLSWENRPQNLSLLCSWLMWTEPRNPFVWICSPRKNGWLVCLLRPSPTWALSLSWPGKGEPVRPNHMCACKEGHSHQILYCLSHVLDVPAIKGNLHR